MSYQLRTGDSLGRGIRRVCRRQIELAIMSSHAPRTDETSPVHETRKHLKKARAALRLLSGVVGSREFARGHRKLRAVARLLSEIRDAEVRLQTMRHLGQLLQMEEAEIVRQAETFLALELQSFLAAFSEWEEIAVRRLTRARLRLKDWEVDDLTCKQIRKRTQQTYKRGRTALQKAIEKPTAEKFHDFRKRSKELMYQLRILHPLDPLLFGELVAELQILTKDLGDAHDLSFLEQRLIEHKTRGRDDGGARALSELMGLREKELQYIAATLGERIYAERPRDFGCRISRRFEEWESRRSADVAHAANGRRPILELNGR